MKTLEYIKLPSTTSFRFYVKKHLSHRVLAEMLAKITVWQDHTIEYKDTVWLGFECLPKTDQAIETLLNAMYLPSNVTEEYINSQK